MSDSHALHPRWPPLLKMDISSNGQNCFILNQNVPKFELYKHNDELFNIFYPVVSEEKTFKKNLQTDDGRQVMAIAHTGKLKIVIKMAILIFRKKCISWDS
jgi:hypothetical protein